MVWIIVQLSWLEACTRTLGKPTVLYSLRSRSGASCARNHHAPRSGRPRLRDNLVARTWSLSVFAVDRNSADERGLVLPPRADRTGEILRARAPSARP